jgi:hypothetical protein
MARVEFPTELRSLLERSSLYAPIRALADRTGEILADNKLQFFPDYTDHGTDHVNDVLRSEVELVPAEVWNRSTPEFRPRLLNHADAAVLIGATLLHDLAMHLRRDGFLELIGPESRFKPLAWFDADHEGHAADRPWHELWADYAREARRFSDRALAAIIGGESARKGWKFQKLPDCGHWDGEYSLVVGEFIRRHHARLAHEIAIYGFPGVSAGPGEHQFSAMGTEPGHPLRLLADLIGLTARSHGTSLRVAKAYLDENPQYAGPRPMEAAVLYPMALLRVADYLQIDRKRAPAVLLQLRNPQSPISVQEWRKHLAVQSITPADDPRSKRVTVSRDVTLNLYLQLRDLLAGIQEEMDHSAAVLGETYGARRDLGLDELTLATRRIESNLHTPSFRDALPYVPERTGFSTDPNLLTLLVEPLYADKPSVGVRELMQNAVDAVAELHAWCKARKIRPSTLDLPKQDADVLIEFIRQIDGAWCARVRDKGIGMKSQTIQNYFLRAGASFRRSPDWAREFTDEEGQPRVTRAGRFGIGAFAVFLLGRTFRMQTRHAGSPRSMGYTLTASADSQLIEVARTDSLPVGTTIEVELTGEFTALYLADPKDRSYRSLEGSTDWFCSDWPKVRRRVVVGAKAVELRQEYSAPVKRSSLSADWSVVCPAGYNEVFWTFAEYPAITCNGIRIGEPFYSHIDNAHFAWPEDVQLRRPRIAVFDSAANLPLTIKRDALVHKDIGFSAELSRDVILSFIAHALVCGPNERNTAHPSILQTYRHPLAYSSTLFRYPRDQDTHVPFSDGLLRWCSSLREFIPLDPWLYSLLKMKSCLIYGCIRRADQYLSYETDDPDPHDSAPNLPAFANQVDSGVVHWRTNLSIDPEDRFPDIGAKFLNALSENGVTALGSGYTSGRVIVSASQGARFPGAGQWQPVMVNGRRGDSGADREYFERKRGLLSDALPLEVLIVAIETTPSRDDRWCFVGCFETQVSSRKPESLIARVWDETLGSNPIPFDATARLALIDRGRGHPELRRHIEAWEKMKGTGSPYAVSPSNTPAALR